jgi:hypothetical protein
MNREQARVLIAETFTQAFDKRRIGTFVANLLNHIDETTAGSWSNQQIQEAFRGHVQRYERLGTFTSPADENLDVLVVHLTTGSKLERARTTIRNFVADHLKTREEKDAALVAFVSPAETMALFIRKDGVHCGPKGVWQSRAGDPPHASEALFLHRW